MLMMWHTWKVLNHIHAEDFLDRTANFGFCIVTEESIGRTMKWTKSSMASAISH
jgi:hypothetical protein